MIQRLLEAIVTVSLYRSGVSNANIVSMVIAQCNFSVECPAYQFAAHADNLPVDSGFMPHWLYYYLT